MDKQWLNEEHTLENLARHLAQREPFEPAPLRACGLTLDYSHHLISAPILQLLAEHCDEIHLSSKLQAMFSGECVNTTEHRPALHTALRDPLPNPIMVDGHNIKQFIREARFACHHLIDLLATQGITDIVHIGMGGSYWGPLCAYQALSHLPTHYRVHFVSTLDTAEITSILKPLKAENTLFILASKSFGTHEMLVNAAFAKAWLQNERVKHPEQHFVAVTENALAAQSWGVHPEYILPVWEWVGGRFSVWSMISLPIILAYGFEVFDAFLLGAHEMDQHLMSQDWLNNMPVLLALIDYWYRVYLNFNSQAIIPYEYCLRSLIPHLQQLHMESLGKPSDGPTGSIVWGALGSHAQHTFNQLLQQGTEIIPIDFILSESVCLKNPDLKRQCLAQRKSLMEGHASSNPYAILPGNRPSNLILLDSLSPAHLGSLLAMYEHKITVLALLYGVNAFDQFGVEYSKELAKA